MSASTLIESFGAEYTFRRYLAGSYGTGGENDGKWTPGAESFLPAQNEIQRITFGKALSDLDSDPYTLIFDEEETEEMVGGDGAIHVQAALEALPNVEGITVTTDDETVLDVEFGGVMANLPQPLLEVGVNELQFEGVPVTIAIERVQPGIAPDTARRTCIISVQTISGRETLLLSEGDRTRESYKGYTVEALKVANEQAKTPGDRVQIDDRLFEVRRRDPFRAETDLPHYRVLLVLVEEDTEEE